MQKCELSRRNFTPLNSKLRTSTGKFGLQPVNCRQGKYEYAGVIKLNILFQNLNKAI
jgi:hypothetical protein